mmetsp:Transcript_3045/g.4671  ORF Transcript_3045/g.4671 Transcript_3045/m.4671 type:complete len:254 (+) Transcript_3045:136-897(+)
MFSRRLSSLHLITCCILSQVSNAFVSPVTKLNQHALFPKVLLAKSSSSTDDNDCVSDRRSILRNVAIAGMGVSLSSLNVPSANAASAPVVEGKIQFGEDDIMSQKEHGTTSLPVQEDLRFEVSRKLADRICCYNRHFAELGGYFKSTSFEDTTRKLVTGDNVPVTFYDSVTGKPLFVAPINRSVEEFIYESEVHGWPSFRDDEVVWDNVRVLRSSGETVSVDGTHLGHNLPDKRGNRYCINLVSIAGNPVTTA